MGLDAVSSEGKCSFSRINTHMPALTTYCSADTYMVVTFKSQLHLCRGDGGLADPDSRLGRRRPAPLGARREAALLWPPHGRRLGQRGPRQRQ